MKRYVVAYVVMLLLFPLVDFLWIGGIARGLYQAEIGQLLAPQPKLAPAAIFYALYTLGVLAFVVTPDLDSADWRRTIGMAALFGLIAYSVYDLTNLSTLKGFSLKIAVTDMAWGVVLTALVASLGRLAARRFG